MTFEPSPPAPEGLPPRRFVLMRTLFDDMVRHAREQSPKEACGLLAGQSGRPVAVWPAHNVDPQPVVRYSMAPKDIIAFDRMLDEHGWEWCAVYHSHTFSEAFPSPTDVMNAITLMSPGLVYLILSLKAENEEERLAAVPLGDSGFFSVSVRTLVDPIIRAFLIENGEVTEIPVDLT